MLYFNMSIYFFYSIYYNLIVFEEVNVLFGIASGNRQYSVKLYQGGNYE